MAAVKLSVISFSSQDVKNPAANLLKSSGGWLCGGNDQKRGRAEVILRLDQSCVLSHIDVGNHGSFTIGIQVARCGDDNFYSLISATTFMTAADSRSAANKHSVRMFKADDFDEQYRAQVWDRIRLTCTQPFRKDKPFGVSMLKVRSELEEDTINNNTSPSRSKLDRLADREREQSDSPNRPSGSKENWFKGAMQGRLQQIANSGQKSQNKDRSMRMVMASLKTPDHKTQLVQDLMDKKSPGNSKPTFMGSVRTFFRGLDLTGIDPYSMKVSEPSGGLRADEI